jgi:hypothetical protein
LLYQKSSNFRGCVQKRCSPSTTPLYALRYAVIDSSTAALCSPSFTIGLIPAAGYMDGTGNGITPYPKITPQKARDKFFHISALTFILI